MFTGPQGYVSQGKKPAVAAGGTVTFVEAAITIAGSAGATTQQFLPLAAGPSGSNRALVVIVCFAGANAGTSSSPTAHWDASGTNQAMTLIGGPYSNVLTGDIYIFGLIGPTTGASKTLQVDWTGANQIIVAAVAVSGADQTGGTTTFRNATSGTGTGTADSVTVTSATGELVVAGHMSAANYTAASQNQTDIGVNNTANVWATAANRAAGGASVTMTYNGGVGVWVSAGCSIKAA